MFYNEGTMRYVAIFIFISVVLTAGYFYFFTGPSADFGFPVLDVKALAYSDIFLSPINSAGRVKPTLEEVKGVHLSYGFYFSERFNAFLAEALSSPINTFVFEIKDPFGRVAVYDDAHISRIKGLLLQLERYGIHTVARMVLFQDPVLIESQPDLAIQNIRTKSVWVDFKGVKWADPTQYKVWEYNAQIARAAKELGFDEINFDYVRFPTDGPLDDARYAGLENFKDKADVIANFLQFVRGELGTNTKLSIDVFGMTFINDQYEIGQVLERLAPFVDILAPMPYPSHYPDGFIGLENPAEYPYDVIDYTLQRGRAKLADFPDVIIRPWLQDFSLGAVYDSEKILAQIQAANDNGSNSWLFWNSANRYNFSAYSDK